MTKVNVISGFLGAGKTTFIKELISKVFAGQKIVLIENEFGEIGIDSGFLKESGIKINEMNSGCICCSLVGDFSAALLQVVDEFAPERILIEPSGVGKLSDVAKAILRAPESAGLELEGKITVVDAKKAKKYLKNFGEFFENQIKYADTVVLSRTAELPEDKLSETIGLIRGINDEAALITTEWSQLSGEVLTKALADKNRPEALVEEEPDHEHHHEHDHEHDHHHEHEHHDHEHEHEHHHDHDHEHEHEHDHDHDHHEHHHHDHGHHHADEIFSSWGTETVHRFDRAELEALLKDLAGSDRFGEVLRAKGIVALTDGSWLEFDMVPEETEFRACSPDYTGRLCVIGTKIDEDALKKAFGLGA